MTKTFKDCGKIIKYVTYTWLDYQKEKTEFKKIIEVLDKLKNGQNFSKLR